jgi:hypothetical protein
MRDDVTSGQPVGFAVSEGAEIVFDFEFLILNYPSQLPTDDNCLSAQNE